MKDGVIQSRTVEFALEIIRLSSFLQQHQEFVISKQLLRSWTSIWANVREAISAQSRADFSHKISIALKEAQETEYWLILLDKSQLVGRDYSKYEKEVDEIIRILSKILITTKANGKKC